MSWHEEFSAEQIRWLVAVHLASPPSDDDNPHITIADSARMTEMTVEQVNGIVDQLVLAAIVHRHDDDKISLTFDGRALAARLGG